MPNTKKIPWGITEIIFTKLSHSDKEKNYFDCIIHKFLKIDTIIGKISIA